MSRTIDAIYEDGVLKPLEPLDLPEHAKTRVTIEESAEAVDELKKRLPFVASGDSGRSDISERSEEILREEWGRPPHER